VEPVTLEGRHVRLEPLAERHLEDLAAVAADAVLWTWTTDSAASARGFRSYADRAFEMQKAGTALPFATISRSAGRPVGSTRFANFDAGNRRVEIGWTWLAREWQRTAVNTEAKYLMLSHAFEDLGCIRVELKTDARNAQSRAAIRRIGGVEEGTLRRHAITESGRLRDTVYYSILDDEWSAVKARLEERLSRDAGPASIVRL
jgi:RimJ/RimL family protein N-acetyltransferase